MKTIKLLIFTLAIFFSNTIFAQDKTPLLSGKIKVSVEDGTIDCDLQLTDLQLPRDYYIRLNKGMNILNMEVKNPDASLVVFERDYTDTIQTEETVSYYIPANTKVDKFYPNNIRFRYTGKFPVIKDTITNNMQRTDWRGNIAFVNNNLRVEGIQSAWYPTIYDPVAQLQYELLRYDITIDCEDCNAMYINGSKPRKGNSINFKSEIPREPILFIGNYDFQESKTTYILNAKFSDEELEEIDSLNYKIFDFLKDYTNIGYPDKLVWIEGGVTEKGNGFAFYSNPAIVVCGAPPVDLQTSLKSCNKNNLPLIIHELCHYYFGNLKRNSSYFECVLNEGFTEFLSYKYLSQSKDKNHINNQIKEALDWFEEPDFKFKAILDFNSSDDISDRETYAYDYTTAILFSIEKVIGEESMKKWIQLLLHGEQPISNKSFFKSTLKQAIGNDKLYEEVIDKYLAGNKTVKNMKKLWE